LVFQGTVVVAVDLVLVLMVMALQRELEDFAVVLGEEEVVVVVEKLFARVGIKPLS